MIDLTANDNYNIAGETGTAGDGGTEIRAAGLYQWVVQGTFNSATVVLKVSYDDGTTWLSPGDDASKTAAGIQNLELAQCRARYEVTGGSSPAIKTTLLKIR